ncbi:protein SPO16 homolog [Dreissena polymorpha]|uniref:protein SPO16 homolog n=1 Tax=Dreissena polymorpha TaxID=45954 RepID=UPI002264D8E2|nr:protein SPO16 homolog [Dreissena polymorpha]
MTSFPVILHQTWEMSELSQLLLHKQLKLRFSDSIIPSSVIFPLSGVASLLVPLGKALATDGDQSGQELSTELQERLGRFLQVHRKCYLLCVAPVHGQHERSVFSLIQRLYCNTRLEMLPVHNEAEAVKCMLTIAKALCKPMGDILSDRLEAIVQGQQDADHMTAVLRQIGLSSHKCHIIADRFCFLSRVSTATKEELLDCSLDASDVDKLLTFFNS